MLRSTIGVGRPFSSPTRLFKTTMSTSTTTGGGGIAPIKFGPFDVTKQVFLKTEHSFAVVNLKPLIPGHVLVCPLETTRLRLTDLTRDETADLFSTVQVTQRLLARAYLARGEGVPETEALRAGSFTVAVQDGPDAGQTVPHVHVHVLPRVRGDMERVDDVYVRMASEEANVGGALWDRERPRAGGDMPRIEDMDRDPRSAAEMEEEAGRYKSMLRDMGIDPAV